MYRKEICDEHLKGLFALQVIDLHQQPRLAKRDQIIAAPTLDCEDRVQELKCQVDELCCRLGDAAHYASQAADRVKAEVEGPTP